MYHFILKNISIISNHLKTKNQIQTLPYFEIYGWVCFNRFVKLFIPFKIKYFINFTLLLKKSPNKDIEIDGL